MFALQADTILGLLWTLFVCIVTKSWHCPWGEQANKSYLGNYYYSSLRDRTETRELRHSRPGRTQRHGGGGGRDRGHSDATGYLFRMRGMHTVQGVPKNCVRFTKKIEDIFCRSPKNTKIPEWSELNWASHKSKANLKLVFSVYFGLKKIIHISQLIFPYQLQFDWSFDLVIKTNTVYELTVTRSSNTNIHRPSHILRCRDS